MLVVYWFRCKNIDVFWVLFGGFLVSVKLGYLHIVIKSQKYKKKLWIFVEFTLCNIFNTSNKQTVAQYMNVYMKNANALQGRWCVTLLIVAWTVWWSSIRSPGIDAETKLYFFGRKLQMLLLDFGLRASAQPHCNTVIIWGDYGRRMGCGMH